MKSSSPWALTLQPRSTDICDCVFVESALSDKLLLLFQMGRIMAYCVPPWEDTCKWSRLIKLSLFNEDQGEDLGRMWLTAFITFSWCYLLSGKTVCWAFQIKFKGVKVKAIICLDWHGIFCVVVEVLLWLVKRGAGKLEIGPRHRTPSQSRFSFSVLINHKTKG